MDDHELLELAIQVGKKKIVVESYANANYRGADHLRNVAQFEYDKAVKNFLEHVERYYDVKTGKYIFE